MQNSIQRLLYCLSNCSLVVIITCIIMIYKNNNNSEYVNVNIILIIVFMLISILFIFSFKYACKNLENITIVINNVSPKQFDLINYIFTFIVPLFTLLNDISIRKYLIVLAVYIIVSIWFNCKSENLINILLIFNYCFYKISSINGIEYILISNNRKIHCANEINAVKQYFGYVLINEEK